MRVSPARACHDAIKVVGGVFPVCYKSCDSDFARHLGMVAAVFVLLGLLSFAGAVVPPYYVGVGRYDVTGPAAEVNMVRHKQYTLAHFGGCMHACMRVRPCGANTSAVTVCRWATRCRSRPPEGYTSASTVGPSSSLMRQRRIEWCLSTWTSAWALKRSRCRCGATSHIVNEPVAYLPLLQYSCYQEYWCGLAKCHYSRGVT